MKRKIITSIIIFGFVCLPATLVKAGNDLEDLKEQIKQLQSTIEALKVKVEDLEKKQTSASSQVAKIPEISESVKQLKEDKPKGFSIEGARVGGHLKLFLFDQAQGKRNGVKQSTNTSAGISHFYLYIDKDLNDTTSISVQPDITVTASATPALGSDISRAKSATTTASIYQAFIKTRLNNGLEIKAGVINPYFSEEYASEVWWDEQYHLNKGIGDIESWHDAGVELYKNFDFKNWSLPAYFYLLNGNVTNTNGKFVDNNNGKTILLHIAPEVSNFRFFGSFGYGKWDDGNDYDSWRYASGLEYKYKKFTLRSEYLFNKFDSTPLTGGGNVDTEKKGYYLKGLYRFNPKWRAYINYSQVSLPYTGGSSLLKDTYKATTLGLNYFFTNSSIIMGEISRVDGDRSDRSEKLDYYRSTIGWRTTF
ncbi:MAG: hypothetical protein PHG87_02025 [Candidatus Omnitrophica bacterium]|nr:hypothetical protein [Candidatus Omnitrophota bacterium]